MRKHARNYMRIYNQFNLPFFAKPGDDLFAAARLDALQKMGAEFYARVLAGQDKEDAQKVVEEHFLKDKVWHHKQFLSCRSLARRSKSAFICQGLGLLLLRRPSAKIV